MPRATHILTTGTTRVLCPVVARRFGKSATLVLHQLHYWLSKENEAYGTLFDGFQWIRNSYNQWQKQIQFVSLSTIRRAFAELEACGVIKSHHFDHQRDYSGGDQVKSYTIDYQKLESYVGELHHTLFTRPGSLNKASSTALMPSTRLTTKRAGDTASFLHVKTTYAKENHTFQSKYTPVQMNTPPAQMNIPANNIYLSKSTFKTISSSEANTICLKNNQQSSSFKSNQTEKDNNYNSQEMIRLWNIIIEHTEGKIALTQQRSAYLCTAFDQFFKNDMQAWERFCITIASSKFLMGEVNSFKANLDWVLKFSTLQRILEGAYSTGDRVVSYKPNQTSSHKSIESPSFISNECVEAVELRQYIQAKLGVIPYANWFLKTQIIITKDEMGKKKTILYVPSLFVRDRIRTHYRDLYDVHFDDIQVGIQTKSTEAETQTVKTERMFVESNNVVFEPSSNSTPYPILTSELPLSLSVTLVSPDIRDEKENISCVECIVAHIDTYDVNDKNSKIHRQQVKNETANDSYYKSLQKDIKLNSDVTSISVLERCVVDNGDRIEGINKHDCTDFKMDIRQCIQEKIGKKTYISWFKSTTFVWMDRRLILFVPSLFIKNRLQIYYRDFFVVLRAHKLIFYFGSLIQRTRLTKNMKRNACETEVTQTLVHKQNIMITNDGSVVISHEQTVLLTLFFKCVLNVNTYLLTSEQKKREGAGNVREDDYVLNLGIKFFRTRKQELISLMGGITNSILLRHFMNDGRFYVKKTIMH